MPVANLRTLLGVAGADFRGCAGAMVEVEKAVCRDVWNPGQFLLELVGGAQRREAQGIRRFEHDEGLVALRKQTIEFGGGNRDRIVGYDQPLDRRIIWHLQGAVDACRSEDQECACNPTSGVQQTKENLNDLGRSTRAAHPR